jgi:hypothetical protein
VPWDPERAASSTESTAPRSAPAVRRAAQLNAIVDSDQHMTRLMRVLGDAEETRRCCGVDVE